MHVVSRNKKKRNVTEKPKIRRDGEVENERERREREGQLEKNPLHGSFVVWKLK